MSFATQKQALNGLVLFFKDVCGMAEVDLGVSLRIKDVDDGRSMITVRESKGDKHRATVLPESLCAEVGAKKEALRALHQQDREAGLPGVMLPGAFARKNRRDCMPGVF